MRRIEAIISESAGPGEMFFLSSLSGIMSVRMRCGLADALIKRRRGHNFDVFIKNFLKKSAPGEKYSARMLVDSGKSSTFAAG